ncbi:HpcH/HpaI aldolase/citrate lyase family protein [Desulfovibrio sp. OttesenSCG-928-C14]|nr:HpcH/HpaI aldolase/citrate lyase family protein [Desulfovibrio sp. OttesenSCG-928-C14]
MEKVLSNPFKEKMQKGVEQFGIWLSTGAPVAAELAASCGYDWVVVDNEHGPNTLTSSLAQLQALSAYPVHPIIRVRDHNPAGIKQVLDLGFKTIVLPMVDTRAQAEAAVSAMRYPPRGIRGVGATVARASRWGRVPDYLRKAEETLCLVVQAESVEFIENMDAITATDGVDAVFIGPMDLSASMGFIGQPGREEVLAAVEKIVRRVRGLGKGAGVFAVDPDFARLCMGWGANVLGVDCDALALTRALDAKLACFKKDGPLAF